MTKKEPQSAAGKVAAGIGAAAALAAIAGSVFVFGTKAGVKQSKKVKGWTLKMKGEVLEKLENLKEVSEERYREVVDTVGKRYENAKKIDPAEVQAMVADMKRHWKSIYSQIEGKKKPHRRSVSKK
jgi:hypothetical protein